MTVVSRSFVPGQGERMLSPSVSTWGECLSAVPGRGVSGTTAPAPLDFHVSDTYFAVAHFHYALFGTVVYTMFAGFPFRWPKFTGRMLDERLGKITFRTLGPLLPAAAPQLRFAAAYSQ